jgi:hypothetical protein
MYPHRAFDVTPNNRHSYIKKDSKINVNEKILAIIMNCKYQDPFVIKLPSREIWLLYVNAGEQASCVMRGKKETSVHASHVQVRDLEQHSKPLLTQQKN